MDSNAVFAVLLLIAGLAILIAEIFVPSGGLLGVITFLSLVVSLVFAYRAWGTSHPNVFYAFLVMLLMLVPIVISFGFYLLPQTSMGKRVLLEGPNPEDLTPFSKESSRIAQLVGRFGSTLSMLNPGGLVKVDGERLHAVSEGLSIDQGTSVEIVDVSGIRVVVRPGTPPEPAANPTVPDEGVVDPKSEKSSSLDFEFPTT